MRCCDHSIQKTLDLTKEMLGLADEGDAASEDTGCSILYGVMRDAAYEIRRLAEAERAAHIKKGWWKDVKTMRGEGIMSQTEKNLTDAFAGESQANRKYLAFAEQAEKEGYMQVAKLFRAAAEAETVHAHAHLKALGAIKSTDENLRTAVAGETHEFKSMYPEMIETAKKEGEKAAERTFTLANEVEKIHAGLYRKALENLGRNEEVDYYVCSVCGMTVEKQAPDKCPVCGAAKKAFFKVS